MAKIRLILILSLFILGLFTSSFVNAEIFLEQPKEIYNLGDNLEVGLSIKETSDSAGFLEINLVCPSKTIILYREHINIEAEEEYSFGTIWPVSDTGLCYIKSEFRGNSASSEKFVLTDRIDAAIELNKEHFLPGEDLILTGKAEKADKEAVEGFTEISIPGLIEKQYLGVEEGSFILEIKIPSDAKAKEYEIQAYIFEKDSSGERTNNVFVKDNFFIMPVPMGIDLSLNDEDFNPREILIIKPSLYDQASEPVREDISIRLRDSRGELVLERIIKYGEKFEYLFESDALPGDWQVEASASGLETKRFVYVNEYAAISADLEDSTLKVKNIGNVPYKKSLEIKFINDDGERIEIRDLDLDVGEWVEFKLSAPDGVYDIIVADKEFRKVPLTGYVVGVIELKSEKPGFLMQYPLISFLVFILLLVLIIFFSHGVRQGTLAIKYNLPKKSRKPQEVEIAHKEGGSMTLRSIQQLDNLHGVGGKSLLPIKKAQSSLVLHGVKQKVSVLFIRIKNIPELKNKLPKTSFDALYNLVERIITSEVEEQKGAINWISDSEILAIFSPNLKQFRHEIASVKAAVAIEKRLNEYNYKLKEKADYGIGINSGDLVLDLQKVMLYTSVGKTIPIARKIAEYASKEVLISKDVYHRVRPEVNAQKVHSFKLSGEDVDTYSIKKVSGREVYKEYVTDVLERIKRDEEAKVKEEMNKRSSKNL